MHITPDEAISILKGWVADKTVLRVCLSRPGASREIHGCISEIKGKTIKIGNASETIEINLYDAEFNGDRRAAANSPYGPYLVCEFRNDDRWAFYAPRKANSETPSVERRS